jgi:hypothetical protein
MWADENIYILENNGNCSSDGRGPLKKYVSIHVLSLVSRLTQLQQGLPSGVSGSCLSCLRVSDRAKVVCCGLGIDISLVFPAGRNLDIIRKPEFPLQTSLLVGTY